MAELMSTEEELSEEDYFLQIFYQIFSIVPSGSSTHNNNYYVESLIKL